MFPHDPHDPRGQRREVTLNPARLITPEEYLAFDRESEVRHEFDSGRMFALAGASERHNLIVANLIISIGVHVRGGPCRVYPSDMRLRVAASGLYAYPDVTVVCGRSELEDEHLDTLLNPTVLIEVLSPSTERHDRGRKAAFYRTLDSLREYLFVSPDQPRVERYARTAERQWTLTEADRREDGIALDSIGCVLPLAEVYAGVE